MMLLVPNIIYQYTVLSFVANISMSFRLHIHNNNNTEYGCWVVDLRLTHITQWVNIAVAVLTLYHDINVIILHMSYLLYYNNNLHFTFTYSIKLYINDDHVHSRVL